VSYAAFYSVNALSIVTCFGLCSSGTPGQKLGFLFDAFDFDTAGTISFDELVILMVSPLRGLRIITGLGKDPEHSYLEVFAKAAFSASGKNTDDYITKDDFVDWATTDLIPKETDGVTLVDVMLKYGVIDEPPKSGAALAAEEATEQAAAAAKIQAISRGKKDRAEIQEQKDAAVKIQAISRGKKDRAAVAEKKTDSGVEKVPEATSSDTVVEAPAAEPPPPAEEPTLPTPAEPTTPAAAAEAPAPAPEA